MSPSIVSLNLHLRNAGAKDHLRHLITDIAEASKYIVREVWHGKLGEADSSNQFGETQLEMDVLSDSILERHLRENELVASYASEEQPELVELHPKGPYTVVFDPLDGSSLVDVNFAIGTIVGIYERGDPVGKTPRGQLAALYIVYGPRTILIYSLGKGKGVHQFFLNDVGEFVLDREFLGIGDEAKNYAPGNIAAASENLAYKKIIDQWIQRQLTIRYSGGMVPDIHHIFAKGNGIFVNLGGGKYPNGKLRLVFECGPFAFLIEEAGGASSNGKKSLLDLKIESLDQRTQIIAGSKNEVEDVLSKL
ncbi:MAG TPA: class 1 fructose-bisphosphatase [Candidatus Peribacterales bacterium]|nr:class 1 fructose-bisphosphatase [Candidatus Peribacterales bacterium]